MPSIQHPRSSLVLAMAVVALAAVGCARTDSPSTDTAAVAAIDSGAPAVAPGDAGPTAELRDASGRVLGALTLISGGQSIALEGRLTGLPPGVHGFHLHETGTCTPPFESAGGHWNPTGRRHGTESPQGPHHGDAPNVTVGADSITMIRITTAGGAIDSLLDADGAAVVVHAGPDDYRTDPSGSSGDRIACGVVTRR